MPEFNASPWSGPNSIPPGDAAEGGNIAARELRTRSPNPSAPRLEGLLGTRTGPSSPNVLVIWDPGQNWPQFSLREMARPPSQRFQRILLRQDSVQEALAEFNITSPAPEGEAGWTVVEVITRPGDPVGMRIGLGLLEQGQRAVLLAGGAGDKDWVRRMSDFVRNTQWEGPALIVVAPADKPSRADRLRKAAWPRGLRAHVLEVFPGPSPDWGAELLRLVCGEGATSEARRSRDTPAPAPAAASPTESREEPLLASLRASSPDSTASISGVRPTDALVLACDAAGALAAALVQAGSGEILRARGSEDLIATLAQQACQFWAARACPDAPIDALSWSTRQHHHLCMPLARDPERLLMLTIDREFGDLSQARWQLAVARQHAG